MVEGLFDTLTIKFIERKPPRSGDDISIDHAFKLI